VLVYLFFAIFAGGNGFTGLDGTAGWMNQAAELAVVAIPVGMLMIAGEFDLSIASVIGMASLTVSIGSGHYNLPMVLSILIALGLAAVIGLLNGFVVVRTGLPSFIVTLASYLAVAGASLTVTRAITNTTTVSVHAHGFVHTLFAGNIFQQFHASIAWAAGLVLLASYVLTCKPFGNWRLATGGDEQAARAAGVPTPRVKMTLFVCTSLGAALLGVIQAIQYNGGQVGQGQNFIFDAIIAAVIGGVLLNGGYGSAVGVAFGAATYGIVSVGIFYTGWNADLAQVIIGLLVLAAVLANNV
jgi:simple sugar transport system permease protein